jgi:very-short-patch-repair endonuclease
MTAPDSVRDLVHRFQTQRSSYLSGSYNETELRRDFLDPFFVALGWDMTNKGGGSEKYREVIHEASVEVQGHAKAADYAFRMGGNNVFFVEAKKPAVNIAASGEAAFQLRSYGWSGKLALSLLTDFEQLAVYDCRDKPKIGEAAHVGRVSLYHYSEYIDKWDELYSRFSREAVFTGKFDAFAGGTKGKKGTTDVDDAFLAMMEVWRELLARNIALRNPGLSVRDLNFAVQTTIDRIIFLRICEDRGIEAEDALRNATDGKDIYQDLLALFKSADRKYNSGLFHFSTEKGESSPADTLTPTLKIDDKVLKDILAGLYHPSPYAFKYIPADILGQVYERFLGRVIRLTPAHQAKVEEKPEVRKAGGVYYTPTYIVDYIVKNTLGELLQGETPETQQTKPLRVLDPACGSGSFLLGAYQYLLDWYLEWYAGHEPARWTRGKSPAVVESQAGWQLTMERKKDILLAHIFGVDIDAQAVEVTKLSLLLKVVENPGQLSLLDERILPDLGENIKCGNSLIGPDYYTGRQIPMFGDEETYRVNAFDWQSAFPQVFNPEKFTRQTAAKPALPPELLKRCRDLRKNQTSAEGLLWSLLRDRQLNGLKFRRQHPLGGYILDFYCHEAQLAVELDGSGHLEAEQARHDDRRRQDLEALGVRVVRFWNHDVLRDPQSALIAILAAVEDLNTDPHPKSNPHPNPLPGGEGIPCPDGFPAPFGSASRGEGSGALGSGLSSSPSGRGARGEGGFDVVIGNPPYIRIQALKEWAPQEVEFYKQRYQAASKGNYDIYVVFVEKGLSLLNSKGRLGFILPNKFFKAQYGQSLRQIIGQGKLITKIVNFGDQQVFNGATTYTCLLFLGKLTNEFFSFERVLNLKDWQEGINGEIGKVKSEELLLKEWNITIGNSSDLYKKLNKFDVRLKDIANRIFQGIIPGADKVYAVELIKESGEEALCFSKELNKEVEIESALLKPIISGEHVKRYVINPDNTRVIYPYRILNNGCVLISPEEMEKRYPKAFSYFKANKKILDQRDRGSAKGRDWYKYIRTQNIHLQPFPKIAIPRLVSKLSFAEDLLGEYCLDNVDVGGIILKDHLPFSSNYLLGLMNSKLLDFYFKLQTVPFRGNYFSANRQYIENLPIRTIDFNDPADVKRHDRMVALVENMLALQKRLAAAGSPQEKELLQRQIGFTDREIDALVYELYGLTEEEIKIVEGANKN